MLSEFLKSACGAALLALGVVGCGASEPSARVELAIVGGTETGEQRASVLFVSTEVSSFGGVPVTKQGSATLVAPNLIVTALHVVSRNPSNVPFTCDATGHEVSGSSGSLLGPVVQPENVSVFTGPAPGAEPVAHGARIVSSGSPTICQNDIAFVVLDQPLELPVVPVHRGAPTELGATRTVIGFGGGVEATGPAARAERDVTVTAVGQWVRTFTVSEGPCVGDSGGPALSPSAELSGVFSSVGVQCTGDKAAAKYTDVSYFSSLVEDAFSAADAGSPWPAASAGEPSSGEAGAGASVGTGGAPDTTAVPAAAATDSGCALQPRPSGSFQPWLLASLLAAARVCSTGRRVRAVSKRRRKLSRFARVVHGSARVV